MLTSSKICVGIDWGRERHQVCVLDPQASILASRSFQHTPAQLSARPQWLVTTSRQEPTGIEVALEVAQGPLVQALQQHGFTVLSINPKQVDRFRDRLSPAGAKDDVRDAETLARALLTDRIAFRELAVATPAETELWHCSRQRSQLVKDKGRISNRLQEKLWAYFPSILPLVQSVTESWFLELLQRAPTPEKARRLHLSTLEKILRKHRIRRIRAEQLQAVLRQPLLSSSPAAGQADCALRDIEQLRLRRRQIAELSQRIEQILKEMETPPRQTGAEPPAEPAPASFHDHEIPRSIPGVGTLVLATLKAEAGEALQSRNYRALRAHAGVAPITLSSGKSRRVVRRFAASPLLRDAVHHWAAIACQHDQVCKTKYQKLRERGKSHGHAVRCVADRLLGVACTLLKKNELFVKQPVKAVA